MAVIQSGVSTDLLTIDPTTKAGRFSRRTIEGNHYSLGGATGLITALGAGDGVFALRWGASAKDALIWRLRATAIVVSGFTAAQEVGLDLSVARGYNTSPSGGTDLTPTASNGKRRATFATSALTAARIASTGALTTGSPTLDVQPIGFGGAYALAAATTVHNPTFVLDKNFGDDGGPLQLMQDEGLILRNRIAMGAGGTMRVYVEVDWSEVGTGAGW